MKDLADRLGLSVSVVSRALNGKAREYRISEETEKAIRAEAARLGFSVNRLARSLRLKKTLTVGLLVPDISNNFFSTVAQSVEDTARRRGYSIILCDTKEDEEIERESLKVMRARTVDGFLISPVGQSSEHILKLYHDGVPVVLIDRFFPGADLPYVTSNNFAGAYDGTIYLLQRGHHEIGFIQGLPESQTNIERLNGYRKALAEYDLAFQESLVIGKDFGERNGFDSALRLFARKNRPTALFVTSAVGALGAMRACAARSLSVPGDVSIIGFDDYPYAPLLSPPLTTIAQQSEAIGRAASELLLDWLEDGKQPEGKGIVLDTRLVVRASVRDLNAVGRTAAAT